jgi:apolipoprotein D and lipocalin family protein
MPARIGRVVAVVMLVASPLPAATPVRADQAAVKTVAQVDLDRYLGEWFEVSRLPNRFQTQCVSDVKARYERRADGRLDVINSCRLENGQIDDARGVARIVERATSAKLKVRFAPAALSFLPMVWGDYWIIGLAEDYSWAVVGSPDRQYLWILSRTPVLSGAALDRALTALRANGFDEKALAPTRQTPNGTRR